MKTNWRKLILIAFAQGFILGVILSLFKLSGLSYWIAWFIVMLPLIYIETELEVFKDED